MGASLMPDNQDDSLYERLSSLSGEDFISIVQAVAEDKQINLKKAVSDRKQEGSDRVASNSRTMCPDCGSSRVVKNGKRNDIQRYLCRACGRRFTSLTGTIMENSRWSLSIWTEAVYSLINGISIKQLSEIIRKNSKHQSDSEGIDYKTCWAMRMKTMHALASIPQPLLSGVIQMGVAHIRESQKGTRHLVSVLPDSMGDRVPRQGRSTSQLGYTGSEFVSVLVAVDSFGNCAFSIPCFGAIQESDVEQFLRKATFDVRCICTGKTPAFMKVFRELDIPHFVVDEAIPRKRAIEYPATLGEVEETIASISGGHRDRQSSQLYNAGKMAGGSFLSGERFGDLSTDTIDRILTKLEKVIVGSKRNTSVRYLQEEVGFFIYLQNWENRNGHRPSSRKDADAIFKEALSAKSSVSVKEGESRRKSWVGLRAPEDDYLVKLCEQTELVRSITGNERFKFIEEDNMSSLEVRSLLEASDLVKLKRLAYICFNINGAGSMTKDALIADLMTRPDIAQYAYAFMLRDSISRDDLERRPTRLLKDKEQGDYHTAKYQKSIFELRGNILIVEISAVDLVSRDSEVLEVAITDAEGVVVFYHHMKPVGEKAWRYCEEASNIDADALKSEKPLSWYKPQIEEILSSADFICSYRSDFVRRALSQNGVAIPKNNSKYFTLDYVLDRMYSKEYFDKLGLTYTPNDALSGTKISRKIFHAARGLLMELPE